MSDQETEDMPCDARDFNIHRKIFVGNISYRIKTNKLTKFFSKFGQVEHCYIVKDHIKGWSKGIGFITFKDTASMEKALQATEQQLMLDGRQMRVKPSELSHKTTFWQNPATNQNEDTWDASCDSTDQSKLKDESHDHEESKSEHTGDTPIDDLVEEILLHIFNMLTFKERVGVERVCHRWRKIIQASWVTYRSLSFKNFFKRFGAGLTDKNLNSALLRCGPYLESLDVSASPGLLTDFSMNVIGNYCPNLKQLDISCVKITDISLQKLVAKCCNLQAVTMNKCSHITDNKGLRSLLQANQDLECIDLSQNLQITGECFRSAGPNIKVVTLSKCLGLKNRCLSHLARNCPHLEELNLSKCKSITREGFKTIVENFKALRILNVSNTSIEDPSSSFSGQVQLANLEHLDISYNTDFSDASLTSLSQNCPNLRYLDISGCNQVTNEGLASLVRLNHLDTLIASFLTRNKQIEDSLTTLADRGLLIKLVVRASPFLTNQGVIHIVSACPRLEHLDLSECFNITNRIFEGFKHAFINENKWSVGSQNLVTPAFSSCSYEVLIPHQRNISGVIHIVSACPRLEHLDLSECFNITNRIFEGFKHAFIDENKTIELHLGGTSVDWIGNDIDWLNGFSHLNVFMNSIALPMRPDADLMMADFGQSDEEDEYRPHPPLSDFLPDGPIEAYDDWQEDEFDDFDDYLDNDDPLETERWNMS